MKKYLIAICATLGFWCTAHADQTLAESKNCMSCHAIDRKVKGPAFRDIKAKYKDKQDAENVVMVRILKGGFGAWGPVPMPTNANLTPADAKTLARWILSQN